MTQEKEPESKMASSPFCDFLILGAGVTPAEGSVKPTAGFTFNQVIFFTSGRGPRLRSGVRMLCAIRDLSILAARLICALLAAPCAIWVFVARGGSIFPARSGVLARHRRRLDP